MQNEERLKITLAQTQHSPDPQENLEVAEKLLQAVAREGSDLVVFPEMFMACPRKQSDLRGIAEPKGGNFISRMAELARKYSTAIVYGAWEKDVAGQEKVANVAVVVDQYGQSLSYYRKVHLFDALGHRESETIVAGNKLPELFSINGVTLGLAICYDLRFPELFRMQVLQGAEVILVPSAWYAGPGKVDQWLTLLRARAIENTVYSIGVTFYGSPFAGHSAGYDPMGQELTQLGDASARRTVQVDTAELKAIRKRMPTIKHVRAQFHL